MVNTQMNSSSTLLLVLLAFATLGGIHASFRRSVSEIKSSRAIVPGSIVSPVRYDDDSHAMGDIFRVPPGGARRPVKNSPRVPPRGTDIIALSKQRGAEIIALSRQRGAEIIALSRQRGAEIIALGRQRGAEILALGEQQILALSKQRGANTIALGMIACAAVFLAAAVTSPAEYDWSRVFAFIAALCTANVIAIFIR